jgi:4-nitrophenyl phosphatase
MGIASLTAIRALILDMDGVLWRDRQPIGDLPAIFGEMEQRGYRVVLATNNATLSVAQYQEKLCGFGVHLQPWQIVTSPHAAVHYLKQLFPTGGPVYIVGEAGLIDTLSENGFYPSEQKPLAVVAGLDRGLTYDKICQASMLIRKGALFIGTNPDHTYPVPGGLAPGAGAVLAAIQVSAGVDPIIVGKPEPIMYQAAIQRLAVNPSETLVVGDRLETDIRGAQTLGCRTALVLSGVTRQEAAFDWRPAPDMIAENLAEVIGRL